jgi:hypothetical protein
MKMMMSTECGPLKVWPVRSTKTKLLPRYGSSHYKDGQKFVHIAASKTSNWKVDACSGECGECWTSI